MGIQHRCWTIRLGGRLAPAEPPPGRSNFLMTQPMVLEGEVYRSQHGVAVSKQWTPCRPSLRDPLAAWPRVCLPVPRLYKVVVVVSCPGLPGDSGLLHGAPWLCARAGSGSRMDSRGCGVTDPQPQDLLYSYVSRSWLPRVQIQWPTPCLSSEF